MCTTNRVQSGVYIALPIAFRPREARVLEAGVEGAGEDVLVGGALDRALGHGRGRHLLAVLVVVGLAGHGLAVAVVRLPDQAVREAGGAALSKFFGEDGAVELAHGDVKAPLGGAVDEVVDGLTGRVDLSVSA